MFRPSDIIIDAFVTRLTGDYVGAFGDGNAAHIDTIVHVARMSLNRIARSNALYHNIDHTMLVTLVGQEMMRGRMVRDGDVSAGDWINFVASLLCFAVGFSRGACPGDDGDRLVVGDDGAVVTPPRGATDGWLWPYFTDRSKIFVRHYFRDHPMLNSEAMAANIEYSRFPPPTDRNHETATYPGLLRAAHLIGAVADPNFVLKMPPLMQELEESGMAALLGYADVADFRIGYPKLFWDVLYPRIAHGMELLSYTGEGRVWLANMHAHLLSEEHRGQIA